MQFYLGNLYQEDQAFDLAVASYKKALAIQPDRVGALGNLAIVLIRGGKPDEAAPVLQKALMLSPDMANLAVTFANALKQAGKIDDAIDCLRQALASAPGSLNLHINLGEALLAKRDFAPAATQWRQAISLDPNHYASHYYLATALLGQQHYEAAIDSFRHALTISPDSVESHFYLGTALQSIGKPMDALAAYRRAIELKPDFAEAYLFMGNANTEIGRLEDAEACYRQATVYNPELADALNNLGSVQFDLGRPDAAVATYRRALQINPEFAEAHSNLASVLSELGHLDAAIESYRRAVEIKPEFAGAYNNLGNVYRDSGRTAEAIASYRKAFDLDPRDAQPLFNLCTMLRFENRPIEAEAACRQALEINPEMVDAIVALGQLRADQGHFVEAEELFRKAISINPDFVSAWANIVRIRKMTVDDRAWLDKVSEIVEKGLPPRQEVYLRYAMGKYFDDLKNSDAAFANYQRANGLSKSYSPKYDQAAHAIAIDQLINSFDAGWMQEKRAGASSSDRPILIVGMPRSGTTLAEQIISSHPSIFGAGELAFWSNAVPLTDIAAFRQSLDQVGLAKLADDYLRYLGEFSNDAPHVVDKMPFNFMFLGIVKTAFPNSRIIHMTRDPIDTSLSIYFQPFESSNAFANDLEDIAHFYRQYMRLMAHWESVLPADAIMTVPYESLVDEPEQWSRKMIEFIGVPWDDQCLDFHKSERTVITASSWQVRQKISKSSVLRWQKYQKYLGPLLSLHAQRPHN
jgi:tetratricopeptide (TPR) repeat protein